MSEAPRGRTPEQDARVQEAAQESLARWEGARGLWAGGVTEGESVRGAWRRYRAWIELPGFNAPGVGWWDWRRGLAGRGWVGVVGDEEIEVFARR